MLPITLLTGFLGAGKTTCLNRYLASDQAADTAILVNEFGEIDIDGAVLSAKLADGSQILSLPNGCICCAVQEDLIAALEALILRRAAETPPRLRCIIETTGLADPGAIIRGVGHDPRLKTKARVQLTVTVCAADRLPDQLPRFEELSRQIAIADRVILSKSDLASDQRLQQSRELIQSITPLADIQMASNGVIAPELLFGPVARHGTLEKPFEIPQAHHHQHHHQHSQVETFSVRLDRPLDPGRFRDIMSFTLMRHAENILRIKGLVYFQGESQPRLINGVHDVFSFEALEGGLATATSGAVVFIGIDLPEAEIRADLESCAQLSDIHTAAP